MIDETNIAYLENKCQKQEEKLQKIKTLIENLPAIYVCSPDVNPTLDVIK